MFTASAAAEAVEGVPPKPPPPFTLFVDRTYSLPAPLSYGVLSFNATRPREEHGTTFDTSIGGGLGLTKRFGVEATIGTLALAPKFRFQSPQLGVFYTALDAPNLEITALGRVTFDVETSRIVDRVEPGVLAITRVPHTVRVDVAAWVPVTPGEHTSIGLKVPVNVGFQLAEHWHAIAQSGVTINDMTDIHAGILVPVGATVGYSDKLANGAGVGIAANLTFPEALYLGGEPPAGPQPITAGLTMFVVPPH
jgi:hypothetical protein